MYKWHYIVLVPTFFIDYKEVPIMERLHVYIGFAWLHWYKHIKIIDKPLKD